MEEAEGPGTVRSGFFPNVDPGPKFLVDGMLGSLAVKLRILGFDAAYDKESEDAILAEKALSGARVLLTSDRELYRHSVQKGARALFITGTGDFESLVEVFRSLAIYDLDRTKRPRCSFCNSTLEPAGREDRWGRPVFKCTDCSRLYWRGSHWKKLDNLFERVSRRLANEEKSGQKGFDLNQYKK